MLKRFFFWRKRDFRWIPVLSNIKVATKTHDAGNLQRFNKNPLLAFFGSLHVTKMVEFLTASLDALVKKGYDSGLLIIGQDEKAIANYLKELPDYLRERIFCTGFCSSEDVSQYLSASNIFLLPLIDGISSRRTTLMTALKHGVPVVSTNGFLIDEISSAIDAKSKWTAGHSERVTKFAIEIGKGIELPEKELKDLELSGLLHDVGKIGTYESILNKAGKLTDEEYKIIKEHPQRVPRYY